MADDDVDQVPRMIADRLARRCWSVTRDDLRQEAELAAMRARTNYDPAKGDLRGYLYRAVARHLTNYMWEAGSPVSYKHRRNELRQAHSVQVENAASLAADDSPAEDAAMLSWRDKVLYRVIEIAGEDARLAGPCLLGDATPMVVAQRKCVPLVTVLEAIERVRIVLESDYILIELHRELTQASDKVMCYGDSDDDYQEAED